MAQSCTRCTYYDAEGNQELCPRCGSQLQFTMLGPVKSQAELAAETADEAWKRPEQCEGVGIEILELPLSIRLGQIGTAIGLFFLLRRIGQVVLSALFADFLMHEDASVAITTFAVISLVVFGIAAIISGAIAGAWSVNWIPQGIGVGLGLFAIPMLLLILFVPESIILYVIIVCVTTPLTVIGAYLGHLLVRPSRIIHS